MIYFTREATSISKHRRKQLYNIKETDLGSGWENDVKEILERAKVLEHQTKSGQRRLNRQNSRRRISPITDLGGFILKRMSTTADMVTTGMVCVVVALVISAVPGARLISPILAIGGAGLLIAAYVRRLVSKHAPRTHSPRPHMWRGRVITSQGPSFWESIKGKLNPNSRRR